MPKISVFYGIIIMMFYEDHNPPHFHVKYGEFEAIINILDFALIQGNIPPKAIALVMEWAALHKEELLEDWNLAIQGKPLKQIAPLV